ncbi:hypothetical protein VCRA2114E365_130117 [Vibrio crassostreae]|nr:hypothetical protein VCHA43P273_60224 [Vibrio chagasii]CAK1731963.1 hypothetical protein VCRA2115O371_120030 [Vibrio crassostreae]CAK1745532.1 hypothetical protein VCRA2114O367_130031 [Vibrio crassostreae]CAK1746118.1 hypothetical protein VCRA2113O354_130030 [Vibrio crassostreae]CAK1747051.1 hypothetical protein VCRA2117O376_130030 [Vibrio crassostreae]
MLTNSYLTEITGESINLSPCEIKVCDAFSNVLREIGETSIFDENEKSEIFNSLVMTMDSHSELIAGLSICGMTQGKGITYEK